MATTPEQKLEHSRKEIEVLRKDNRQLMEACRIAYDHMLDFHDKSCCEKVMAEMVGLATHITKAKEKKDESTTVV